MPKGKRRDVYRKRTDPLFNVDEDIDLEHMRYVMSIKEPSNVDLNYYGLYVMNIIKIMLNSSKLRGYPDDVKEDIMGEALCDTLRARTKFNGEKYPQATAPFSYTYAIAFHSAQHVLAHWYKMQSRMTAASQVGAGAFLAGSCEEFSDDIIDKAVNDWDAIAENLRD